MQDVVPEVRKQVARKNFSGVFVVFGWQNEVLSEFDVSFCRPMRQIFTYERHKAMRIRALSYVAFAMLIVLAPQAQGQFFGGNGVSVGLPIITQHEGPALTMSVNYTGVVVSPLTKDHIGSVRNSVVRTPRGPEVMFGVNVLNVEWRDRGVKDDERVFAEYMVQQVGASPSNEGRYEPMQLLEYGDKSEANRRQPSGLLEFKIRTRDCRTGSYQIVCRMFLAQHDRTKLASDLPIIGRALTFSKRGEVIGYFVIPFDVVDVDWVARDDDDLREQLRLVGGMNPLKLSYRDYRPRALPGPAMDPVETKETTEREPIKPVIPETKERDVAATIRILEFDRDRKARTSRSYDYAGRFALRIQSEEPTGDLDPGFRPTAEPPKSTLTGVTSHGKASVNVHLKVTGSVYLVAWVETEDGWSRAKWLKLEPEDSGGELKFWLTVSKKGRAK